MKYVKARAIPESYELIKSSTGSTRVALGFRTEFGDRLTYFGGFGDTVHKGGKSSTDYTFETLINAGMTNDDLDAPEGLGDVDVELAIGENDEGEDEIKYVNAPGGRGYKNALDAGAKAKFGADMRAKMIRYRQSNGYANGGGGHDDGKLPF